MKCNRCNDTGQHSGNGFMLVDCKVCSGEDDIVKTVNVALDKIDRRSSSYKRAIEDIMSVNKDISRKAAVKMFDEAYVKS